MEKPSNQNFENHGRLVPGFHGFTFGILILNLLWSIYRVVHLWPAPSGFLRWDAVIHALLAVGLLLLFFYARVFALTVQDRVIRLEMMLRMGGLLPADLKSRFDEFTIAQLVALRFASDAELPVLARKVLDERLTDRKAIKRMIKNWKPDFLRA